MLRIGFIAELRSNLRGSGESSCAITICIWLGEHVEIRVKKNGKTHLKIAQR